MRHCPLEQWQVAPAEEDVLDPPHVDQVARAVPKCRPGADVGDEVVVMGEGRVHAGPVIRIEVPSGTIVACVIGTFWK